MTTFAKLWTRMTKPKTPGNGQTGKDSPLDLGANLPEPVVLQGELIRPTPRPGSLATVRKVRQELARAYRDARQRKMDPTELSKLAYTLNILGRLAEIENVEERMDRIEAALGGRVDQ